MAEKPSQGYPTHLSLPTSGKVDEATAGDAVQDGKNNIQVAVRCRPFSANELNTDGNATDVGLRPVLECSQRAVRIHGEMGERVYGFDHTFGPEETQQAIFDGLGAPLLKNAMNAYNGCIFAYGQTGAGKSHSMVGDVYSDSEHGLLPRACARLFEMLHERQSTDPALESIVLASYLEIYNEKPFDLLSSGRQNTSDLQIRLHPTHGSIVLGLTECPVQSSQEALNLLDFGAKKRAVGATQMNATSSRSHAVFTIQLRMTSRNASGRKESQARLHFVDLAGSERQKKTAATGDRLKEGIGINQSLATLGRVISDLTKSGGKSIPPFRDSKLTMLLKDALMGNSRTALLACISPAQYNLDETIGTLEFASRCKMVKTTAKKNEQAKEDVIAGLKNEKQMIEYQLFQEREQGEKLRRQLQDELEKAREKNRDMETILEEKKSIEEKLKQLQGPQNQDMRRSRRMVRKKTGVELDDGALTETPKKEGRKKTQQSPMKPMESPTGSARSSVMGSPRSSELPPIGALVLVSMQDEALYGYVRYAGPVNFTKGSVMGLELVEEQGKNDGSVQGERYFSCAPGHGLFLRPEKLLKVLPDMPGKYSVIQNVALTAAIENTESSIAEFAAGDSVDIVEVSMQREALLVRGRVESPPGWITLLDEKNSVRWAGREEPAVSESLLGPSANNAEMMRELQQRLKELEFQEQLQRQQNSQDMEVRTNKLRQEQEARDAREKELKLQMDALKEIQESLALDRAQVDAKRTELQKERETELAKLGMHVSLSDLTAEDMAETPKLVNLHPDPALKGCLIYCLPEGQTQIGSDEEQCRITLSGMNIHAIVCTICNTNNDTLNLEIAPEALARVNGSIVTNDGCALCDGDRLAIGRAYIFMVRIPKAANGECDSSKAEMEFETAMAEISASAEIDPQWENGVHKAMRLVKSDYGTEAANHLLKAARRASEAVAMANSVLEMMPEGQTDGVVAFELAVLFDARGLPEVCVAARRADEDSSSVHAEAGRRRGGMSAGIWQIDRFWDERLPFLYEALNESMSSFRSACNPMGGEQHPEFELELERWERHVWGELAVTDYKMMVSEVSSLRERLATAEKALASVQQDPNNRRGGNTFFDFVHGAASASIAAASEVGGHLTRSRSMTKLFGHRLRLQR